MWFRDVRLSLTIIGVLAAWAPTTQAYDTYTASPGAQSTNCAQCHGAFTARPYFSLHDGSAWSGSLHDIHQSLMLSGDCDTCHSAARNPVFLNSSNGGMGLAPISCVGCHGRTQDRANPNLALGDGAGLRQHHFNAGVTDCVNCHNDANPARKRVVAENVPPPFYFSPDSAHPNKPTDPCNAGGKENSAGSPLGLDNDGNGLFDMADPACGALAATPTSTPTNTASVPTHTATNPVPATRTPTRTVTSTAGLATSTPTRTAAQLTSTPGSTSTPTNRPAATNTAARTATVTSTPIRWTPTATSVPTSALPGRSPTPTVTSGSLSGAALYSANCVSCHGDPRTTGSAPVALRKVPGARICSIQAAISGTPSMQFLGGRLSAQQLQAIATFLNSFSVSGQQRYTTACAACHGANAGGSAGSISEAISEVRAMRFLSCLPSSDLSQIGSYLGSLGGSGEESGSSERSRSTGLQRSDD